MRKIQSWGVLAISCQGLGKTGHGCCIFFFVAVACSTVFGGLGAAGREGGILVPVQHRSVGRRCSRMLRRCWCGGRVHPWGVVRPS